MAARGAAKLHCSFSAASVYSSRFAPLLLLLFFFFLFSFPSRSSPLATPDRMEAAGIARERCNYSEGACILDTNPDPYMRYDHTCKEIFKGWNCISSGKTNARDLLRWRWQPSGCRLPRLDPLRFLEHYRNTNIGLSIAVIVVFPRQIMYIENRSASGSLNLFRTQSTRHLDGGDWNQGGSCRRTEPLLPDQVKELFSLKNNGTNVEVRIINEHLFKALEGSRFRILDITHISEFRADAHPSIAGGKKHEDRMHWCLPGLTDTWNDILIAKLEDTMS